MDQGIFHKGLEHKFYGFVIQERLVNVVDSQKPVLKPESLDGNIIFQHFQLIAKGYIGIGKFDGIFQDFR